MKSIKCIIKTSLMLLTLAPFVSFAQELTDEKTFVDDKGRTFKVGDDLTIGEPTSSSGFKYIANSKKRKTGWLSKAAGAVADAGESVVQTGSDLGSSKTLKTGYDVNRKASAASNATSAGEKLLGSNKMEDIAGQSLRILKFRKTGNEERGEHFFALVAGPGKTDYDVELIPAIKKGEIVGINDEPFKK
ncbi:hypothetical protein SAMN05216436_112119 [bacterium A37T11]|nr:hypothetical protein SAMN05216436_112119 [bacterium A37T11]